MAIRIPQEEYVHWTVFGFSVLCGADVQHLRLLTRDPDRLTCAACRALLEGGAQS